MPHIYYPDPNSTTSRGQAPGPINSATNTTPVELDVTGHGFSDGDQIEVSACAVPALDGLWNITVTGTDTFTLDGSTASGVGGAGGYVVNYSVLPNSTMVDDGDSVDAANTNSPLENVTNALPFLYQRVGVERRIAVLSVATNDDTWAAWSTNAPGIFGTAAWASVANGGSLFGAPSSGAYAKDDDLIEVGGSLTYVTNSAPGLAALALQVTAGATSYIVGAVRLGTSIDYGPVRLGGRVRVTGLGAGVFGALNMSLVGYGDAGSPKDVTIVGSRAFQLAQLRRN